MTNELEKQKPSSTAHLKMKELSTERQRFLIGRLFERLSALYGAEFSNKFSQTATGLAPEAIQDTWASVLGPYTGNQIAAAIQDCNRVSKAPTAPEFAELCRQVWVQDRVKADTEAVKPLSLAEKAKWQEVQSKALESVEKPKEKLPVINGIQIDKYRKWAVNLMKREASGEAINDISAKAWREVLRFPPEITAREALNG